MLPVQMNRKVFIQSSGGQFGCAARITQIKICTGPADKDLIPTANEHKSARISPQKCLTCMVGTSRWTWTHYLPSSQPKTVQFASQPTKGLHHGIAAFARHAEQLPQAEPLLFPAFPLRLVMEVPLWSFDDFQVTHGARFAQINFPTTAHSAKGATLLQKQPRTNQVPSERPLDAAPPELEYFIHPNPTNMSRRWRCGRRKFWARRLW